MAGDLLERLKESSVLCDGAMGTLLYAKGIFINRCYDELNLSQPELIRAVHHEYLQSGAKLLKPILSGPTRFVSAATALPTRCATSTWRARMWLERPLRVLMFGWAAQSGL